MVKFNFELDYSRIKELRLKNNLTQAQMAEILNIRKETYTQFECMRREVFPIEKINDIANYFKVSMDYLLNLSSKSDIEIIRKELDWNLIGERLKKVRKENKLYQETLANSIGCSIALISEYEKGKRLISLSYGYSICKKLNVSMDYLYGKVDEPIYLK